MSGIHVETLLSPKLYTYEQIERALTIACILARGRFVLVEAPEAVT